MVALLSIKVKSDYFCLESTYAQTYVKGCLLLNYDNNDQEEKHYDTQPHDILHNSSTCVQIIGREWITDTKDDDIILIDDTYHIPTLEWQHHPEHKLYILPFNIPLPGDIPITFVSEDGGIDYTVSAHIHIRNLKTSPLVVKAARPLILFRRLPLLTVSPSSSSSSSSLLLSPLPSLSPSLTSSSSLLSSKSVTPSPPSSILLSAHLSPFLKAYPPLSSSPLSPVSIEHLISDRSKLCWGMSTRSQWQYELELPQLIYASQPFSFTLRTRIRNQLLLKNSSSMESCMLGIQIYESVQMGCKPNRHRVLMITSDVLTEPSKTWSIPCTMTLELDQIPKSSTLSGSRIKVSHHFQITLNYCSAQGQSDRVNIDCTIPLITLPPLTLPTEGAAINTYSDGNDYLSIMPFKSDCRSSLASTYI